MTSNHSKMSNEKFPENSQPYARFGENIRYLTWDEWNRFLDVIDNSTHKLMMQGCSVLFDAGIVEDVV